MKYIFLNLKRFEIPASLGGINRGDVADWAATIIRETVEINRYSEAEFAVFLPEAHLPAAIYESGACNSKMHIGCQSVFRHDVEPGKNFGAFTSNRTALSMKSIGVDYTLIGHSEERKDKIEILNEAGPVDNNIVNRLLNMQIKKAVSAGLKVVYCIGETSEEQPERYAVLRDQLDIGLAGIDSKNIVIAYEPIWAIGPGKVPPDAQYVLDIVNFIKSNSGNLPVVYGGGLKKENAKMLSQIPGLDGGLIALTRFTGEIGFYSDEYLEIVNLFLG